MFYIISKIFVFLLSPGFWIVTLLVFSFIFRGRKIRRWLRFAALALFIIFTNSWFLNTMARCWQPSPVQLPAGSKFSAAILLGGMTMTDRQHRNYFAGDADRFIQATKLFHMGVVDCIAVTGGSPSVLKKNRTAEAARLFPELVAQGVPANRIVIETGSKNTFENAVLVKKKLDSMRLPPPYLLITSAIHMPRSLAVFRKAGITVKAYPAAYKQVDYEKDIADYFLPSIHNLTEWNYFLKELVGLQVYRLTGKA